MNQYFDPTNDIDTLIDSTPINTLVRNIQEAGLPRALIVKEPNTTVYDYVDVETKVIIRISETPTSTSVRRIPTTPDALIKYEYEQNYNNIHIVQIGPKLRVYSDGREEVHLDRTDEDIRLSVNAVGRAAYKANIPVPQHNGDCYFRISTFDLNKLKEYLPKRYIIDQF